MVAVSGVQAAAGTVQPSLNPDFCSASTLAYQRESGLPLLQLVNRPFLLLSALPRWGTEATVD